MNNNQLAKVTLILPNGEEVDCVTTYDGRSILINQTRVKGRFVDTSFKPHKVFLVVNQIKGE
jgi:hypothetical protein